MKNESRRINTESDLKFYRDVGACKANVIGKSCTERVEREV